MKRYLALAALALAATALSFADETTEIYQMLYQQAQGLPEKHAALLNLVGLGDKSTAPILASALDELLLSGQRYSAPGEQELYGSTIRVVAQALGDYKYESAAASLWEAAQSVPDTLAQAEAIMSLGKMRALDYAERIALKLQSLNLQPTMDRDQGEKLAYACVIALAKLKDPRGFAPVFFAAEGWYSQRVRQQAAQALPDIAADPTDPIKDIIGHETIERKIRALQAESDSKAEGPRKIETAVLALNLGHLQQGRDRTEAKLLSDLRKLALRMLIINKDSGADAVSGGLASYQKGFDDEERLLALQALGVNGSDPAATALRDLILQLNSDQKSGIADETRNRMAKAAIEYAALTKNKIVKPSLMAVSIDDQWSSGIIVAAQAALKAMP
jgi:hypothetical protein